MFRLGQFVAFAWLVCFSLLTPESMPAEPIAVRHTEGLVHGFLVLRTLDGDSLAEGDLIQFSRGSRVTTRLLFRFKDGSVHDETAVFSQRGTFQLLSYHLIQKGPEFQHPIEVKIDVPSGMVTVTSNDDKGIERTTSDHFDLPPDLANGLVTTLLKNMPPDMTQAKVSMLAANPKPRLVKLAIKPQGVETFTVSGAPRKAMHYVVKVEIAGSAGLIAPIAGKQPPDIHVWILGQTVPAFVKMEGPLCYGGPIWRIELASPVWPRLSAEDSKADHPKN
jgi:hypothetical protein